MIHNFKSFINESNFLDIKLGDEVEAIRYIDGSATFYKGVVIDIDKSTKMIKIDLEDSNGEYAWFYYEKTSQLGSYTQIFKVNGDPYAGYEIDYNNSYTPINPFSKETKN